MYLEDPEYRLPMETTDLDELTTLASTRKEAIELGSKFFFTGKLCKFGHLEKRKTYSGECVACIKVNTRRDIVMNPESYAAARANRRSMKFVNGGRHTAKDIRNLFEEQEGLCKSCGACLVENSYHVDHIIPLILGGKNSKDNLQLLCPTCNLRKGSLRPEEWELKLLAEQLEKEEV